MRFTTAVSLCFAALLSGCAIQGVVVEKRFRPLPFPDSLGVDGIYNFQLRDAQGQVHSQMVTPGVFALYEVGDYFNDLGAPPAHDAKGDPKDQRPPMHLTPPQFEGVPYDPNPVPLLDVPIRPRPLRTRKPAGVQSDQPTYRPMMHQAATAQATTPKSSTAKTTHSSSAKTAQKKHRSAKKSVATHKTHRHAKKSEATAATHKRKKKSAKVTSSQHHAKKKANKIAKVHKRSTAKKIASRG